MFLAQATTGPHASTFLDRLEIPTQAEYVNYVSSAGLVTGAVLLACGLVYLLQGWKTIKVLIVINAAVIGAFAGTHVGGMLQGANAPLYCAVAGAVLLGALALPTLKYALSIMGGLGGAVLGYLTMQYLADALNRPGLAENAWAGALVGLILLGMLAFALFKLAVVVLTSIQGATMTVTGLLTLLMKHRGLSANLEETLLGNVHLIPLLILVPSAIGFIVQESAVAKKAAKKRRRSSSDS
jgi:hypothetical protein